MASLQALVVRAHKLASAGDFSGALELCEEGMKMKNGGQFFPLVSLHGFCAMSVKNYEQAEKFFMAAKLLEAAPPLQQKNVKYLAETYEALGLWRRHAEELCHLYRIAQGKGNMERVMTLSSQIVTSYEKCEEYNSAGVFLVDHLGYVVASTDSDSGSDKGCAAITHGCDSLIRLQSLKTAHFSAHEEKKIAKTSIGTQEIVASPSIFDQDLLKNASLLTLLLQCLRQLAVEQGQDQGEGRQEVGPLMSLLLTHLLDTRADVFRAPSTSSAGSSLITPLTSSKDGKHKGGTKSHSAAPSRVTYRDVLALATEAYAATSPFFAPSSSDHPASLSPLACASFLHICQVLVEAWFFVPEEAYESIAEVVERGQQVSRAASTHPSSSATASSIASFLASAHILHCISSGDKATAVLLAKQVAPFWVSSIQRHQNMVSSSRKDTMKTPTSSFQLTTAQLQESSEGGGVVVTLCLCVAVALGALGGFRADTFHGLLSLSDGLYLTQEISNRVICLKKILLALEYSNVYSADDTDALVESEGGGIAAALTRGKLRQTLLELVPLGRVRLLLQIRQEHAAFDLCRDQQWLRSLPAASDVAAVRGDQDSTEQGSGRSDLRVDVQQVAGLLPVSRWVLMHALGGGTSGGGTLTIADRGELAQVMGATALFTGAGGDSGLEEEGGPLFSSLLQIEKEWMLFLLHLDTKSHNGASTIAADVELSFTADLLRDQAIADNVIAAFAHSLNTIATASSSPYMTSFAAEMVQFRIGIAQWLGEKSYRVDKAKCLAQLIKTAKLNPQFGSVYSFIGHYYLRVLNDTARAAKCYIKALAFDPIDAEAGISLSQIYIESDELSKVRKLWDDVNTLTVSHAFWCFSLSGQLKFCLQQYEDSIQDFQKSLELRGEDLASWHSLSMCYSSLGQNVAASKSLQCALALIASKTPAQQQQWERMRILLVCELAEIERRMGCFQDSYDHFDEVRVLTAPSSGVTASAASSLDQHVVALKGLGDVCLALGYERMTCGWTRGACAVVIRGIAAMDSVLELHSSLPAALQQEEQDDRELVLACLLKLKGDLCAFCRYFSPADHVTDSRLVIRNEARGSGTGVVVNVRECSYDWLISQVAEAEASYRKLLAIYHQQQQKQEQRKLQKQKDEEEGEDFLQLQASVWCDIGSTLYYQASLTLAARGQGSGLFSTNYLLSSELSSSEGGGANKTREVSSATAYLRKAMTAFAQGLLLRPSHSGCWNGAGVCCRLDDSLRELCLVRSTLPIAGENPSPAGYANLGNLFLAHNRQHCAKECLSALQLLESNPLHWLVLGGLLEKEDNFTTTATASTANKHRQRSVFDAYTAALEVSKPVEGLLGVAVAYLQLHSFLVRGKGGELELVWSNHPAWPLHALDLVQLRYSVEHPLSAFLYRRPHHPFAWSLLAWALVQRQAWGQAAQAYVSLLQVVEQVVAQTTLSLPTHQHQQKDLEKEYYVDNIRRLVTTSMQGLELCGRMARLSSPPTLSPPPTVSCSDYPCIEQLAPQFTTNIPAQSPLTKENMIMKAFEEYAYSQCCSLLSARRTEMLSSVQRCDVADVSRLQHWVRWMQMAQYFVDHSVEANKDAFLGCLVPVGYLLCSVDINNTSSNEEEKDEVHQQQRCYVLNAFRLYPEGFLQVGEALMVLDKDEPRGLAASVLELGLTLHPRNDAILRMLGRADPNQLQSAAVASLNVTRDMLTATCSTEEEEEGGDNFDALGVSSSRSLRKSEAPCYQLVDMPVSISPPAAAPPPGMGSTLEYDIVEQPPSPSSQSHVQGQDKECVCVCPQRRVNRSEAVISAFSDSVALHSAHSVQTGRRCSRSDRKDLLTALWLDPSNFTTWAALAGSVFSDVALGPIGDNTGSEGNANEEEQGEATSIKEQRAQAEEVGVFSDGQLVTTCMEIVLFLHRTCPPVGAYSSQMIDMSLVCDWGADGGESISVALAGANDMNSELRTVLKLVSTARNQVFMSNYQQSVPMYERVIRDLTASSLPKSLLAKILIEFGNVYSYLLLPEQACEQYKLSETVAPSQEDSDSTGSSVSSLVSLFCAVAFARKASVSSDHNDVTKAREYADETCEHASSSHVASAHLVKALVWLSLSKPNKVKQEVAEATAICKSVDVPF